jgi:fatty acid-binding protein DegV
MAGSTGEKAAAEVAAEVMAEGLRQTQMGVERLRVLVRDGRVEGWVSMVLWLLRGGLAVPLLLWRRGESFMKRWSVSLDV